MGIKTYLDKNNVLCSLFILDPTSHANSFPKTFEQYLEVSYLSV